MQQTISTPRPVLAPLTLDACDFIIELVNTAGWLQFIGDRNVRDEDAAKVYIQNILANPNVRYWVIRLKESLLPAGVVTLIKRDHLPAPDLGFALLPQYEKKGLAFEAAREVLTHLRKEDPPSGLLAILAKHNHASIHLLEKLGFRFDKELVANNETLLLYALPG